MSRWADWFPVTPDESDRLLVESDEGDDAVMKVLQPWLERLEELPDHVDMDKAWEPIHRCLTGDLGAAHHLDFEAGEPPLNLCVLGGEQLLEGGYRSAGLVLAPDVPEVAAALSAVKRDWLRERFFALPDNQFHEIEEEVFDWVWAHFEDLPPFFGRAAAAGNAVICTISH